MAIKKKAKKNNSRFWIGKESISVHKFDISHIDKAINHLDKKLSTSHSINTMLNVIRSKFYKAYSIEPQQRVVFSSHKVNSLEDLKNVKRFIEKPKNLGVLFDELKNIIEKGTGNKLINAASDIGLNATNIVRLPEIKYGLALSGGGSKGCFESGVILYLEQAGILMEVDIVAGSSAGSINALGVSAWKENSGTNLSNIWLSLRQNSDMYLPTETFEEVKEILDELGVSTSDEATNSIDFNTLNLMACIPIVGNILARVLLSEIEEKISLIERLSVHLNDLVALYDLSPVKNLLSERLPQPSSENLPLRMVTVTPKDGSPHYIDEEAKIYRMSSQYPREVLDTYWLAGENHLDALIRGAIASASIPLVFGYEVLYLSKNIKYFSDIREALRDNPIQTIHDVKTELALDGGLRDLLPLEMLIDAGAKDVIAVTAYKRDLNGDPSFNSFFGTNNANPIHTAKRTAEIILHEIGETDRFSCNRLDSLTIVEPEFEVHDSVTISPALIRINIEYGYMRAFNKMTPFPDEIEALLNNGTVGGLLIGLLWIIAAVLSLEEISSLRSKIYYLEQIALEQHMDETGQVVTVWRDESTLNKVRSMKADLFELYQIRVSAWGAMNCVPGTLSDGTPLSESWLSWEQKTPNKQYMFDSIGSPFERQQIAGETHTVAHSPDELIGTWHTDIYFENIDNVPDAPNPLIL